MTAPRYTARDELTELRLRIDTVRGMVARHQDRRLPILLTSAPEPLVGVFREFLTARSRTQDADIAAADADAAIEEAKATEAREIRRRVLADQGLEGVPDYVGTAVLTFKRKAQVYVVRASQLKEVTGKLITTAMRYRNEQLATYQQPLAEASRVVAEARAAWQRAENHRAQVAEQLAFWVALGPTNFPGVGEATKAQIDEIIANGGTAVPVGDEDEDEDDIPPHLSTE